MTRRRRRTRRRRIHTTCLYRTRVISYYIRTFCLFQIYGTSAHSQLYTKLTMTYWGILASEVPFLFPKPLCLPILLAAVNSLARARECIVTCLRMVWRELAFEISLVSLGSSHILRFPQPTTEAARRFWVRRLTLEETIRQLRIQMMMRGAVLLRSCVPWE